MTYQETLEELFDRLPMYQRDGKSALKKDLSNTLALLDFLGNPHKRFKSVHIAGTNGKGTCAHGIAAILQHSGYKTGLYTSPHLKQFTERIRINGAEVAEEKVIEFVSKVKPVMEKIQPSFFELTVAMAFDHFAAQKVDIAVVETGLGGRLDSTNVIIPETSLITNIGFDHTDLLGETLAEIAGEKAGIIKENVPVVIGEFHEETFPVFENFATQRNAPLRRIAQYDWPENTANDSYTKLLNRDSIRTVCVVLNELGWKIAEENIREGLDNIEGLTGLRGRYQLLESNPTVVADVSHNEEGLKHLFSTVGRKVLENKGRFHLIFGTVKDKSLTPIFKRFPVGASITWTQSNVPRALSVEELAIQGVMHGLEGECFKDVNEALRQVKQKAKAEDVILITGSTFVIAEIEGL